MTETKEEREIREQVLREKIIGAHQREADKDAAKARKQHKANEWSRLPYQGVVWPAVDYSDWPTLPTGSEDYYTPTTPEE